jgi:hypothetical protein
MFPRPVTPGSEIENAGGAYVRRRLTFGERVFVSGDMLTAEEVASIPRANLHSLVNTNIIELYPRAPRVEEPDTGVAALLTALWLAENPPAPPIGRDGECFLMPTHDPKKFHIIQGQRVTSEAMTRAQAQAKMKELSL